MVGAVDPQLLTKTMKTKIHTRGRAAAPAVWGSGRAAPRAARARGARERRSRADFRLITYIRALHMTHEDMTS